MRYTHKIRGMAFRQQGAGTTHNGVHSCLFRILKSDTHREAQDTRSVLASLCIYSTLDSSWNSFFSFSRLSARFWRLSRLAWRMCTALAATDTTQTLTLHVICTFIAIPGAVVECMITYIQSFHAGMQLVALSSEHDPTQEWKAICNAWTARPTCKHGHELFIRFSKQVQADLKP